MFPCVTARRLRTEGPLRTQCDKDGTRNRLGVTSYECPRITRAVRPGKYPEPVARGMIARVVRLPAFRAGLKNEMARRFCCRRPTCDPSARRLPRYAVPAFSSRRRRFETSIGCRPEVFRQLRCSTLVTFERLLVRRPLQLCIAALHSVSAYMRKTALR